VATGKGASGPKRRGLGPATPPKAGSKTRGFTGDANYVAVENANDSRVLEHRRILSEELRHITNGADANGKAMFATFEEQDAAFEECTKRWCECRELLSAPRGCRAASQNAKRWEGYWHGYTVLFVLTPDKVKSQEYAEIMADQLYLADREFYGYPVIADELNDPETSIAKCQQRLRDAPLLDAVMNKKSYMGPPAREYGQVWYWKNLNYLPLGLRRILGVNDTRPQRPNVKKFHPKNLRMANKRAYRDATYARSDLPQAETIWEGQQRRRQQRR